MFYGPVEVMGMAYIVSNLTVIRDDLYKHIMDDHTGGKVTHYGSYL